MWHNVVKHGLHNHNNHRHYKTLQGPRGVPCSNVDTQPCAKISGGLEGGWWGGCWWGGLRGHRGGVWGGGGVPGGLKGAEQLGM